MRKSLFFYVVLFFAFAAIKAQTVVWSDNFNDQNISDWTLYDQDGDGFEWSAVQLTDDFGAPTGTPILTSVSWAGIPLFPDNWAVSPAINLTSATGDTTLKWFVFASDPLWNLEKYSVYVGTSNTVSGLMAGGALFTEDVLPATLTERTLDLSSFAGQTIYVAFRHYNTSDQFRIGIDDVSVYYGDDGGPTDPEYCTPGEPVNNDSTGITNVTFEDINNTTTGAGTYQDYTSMVANVEAGQTYPLSIKVDTQGSWYVNAKAWIDWNNNGVFDSSEAYDLGQAYNVSNGATSLSPVDIAIPTDASGDYRLRVRAAFGQTTIVVPCDPLSWSEAEDYTIHVAGDTPPPTGEDCEQGDDSNNFENGLQIGTGTDYRNADDFYVSAGNTLNVKTIELNALAVGQVDSISFTFYEDNGGAPGATVVEQTADLVPYDQVLIGNAFGYDVYAIYVDVDLNFTGGASGTSYWMHPTAVAPGGTIGGVFWEVSSAGTLGAPIHGSTLGGPWTADVDGSDGVFKLHCEHVTPPTPPCNFNITFDVEPITRVVVSDIDNTSSAVINGSPAMEDFTSVEGHVAAGESYDVAFEGNTAGSFTTYFTVFADWNQDGDFTDSGEMYEIGSITNSTGTDGQQATGSITVPSDAVEGSTIMRVIKAYGASPTNPCGTYNYGQAEEYTIIVGDDVPPTGGDCSESTPSNNFENGHGNLHLLQLANDFTVGDNQSFTVNQVKFNVILPAGQTVDAADVYFYADTNGAGPGAQVGNGFSFVVPTSVDFAGNLSTFDVSTVTLDLPGQLLEGVSGSETTYWLGIMIYTDAANSYWEGTSILNTANEGYLLNEGVWSSISSTFGSAAFDGVFEISGECAQLGISDMDIFEFAYYPNPVKDVLNISSKKSVENVSVFNLAGQKVLSNAKVSNGQINVNSLTPGTYVFRVTLEGGQVETFKIIKK